MLKSAKFDQQKMHMGFVPMIRKKPISKTPP